MAAVDLPTLHGGASMNDTPGWSAPDPQGARPPGDRPPGDRPQGGQAAGGSPPGWSAEQPPAQPGWAQPPTPQPQPGWGQAPAPQQGWGWQRPPEVKPGVIPLRPLGVGEILDGAISTMRAHPKLMLGFSAIVVAVSQVISTAMLWLLFRDVSRLEQFDENTPPSEIFSVLGGVFAGAGAAAVITVLAQVFLTGFLTVVVSRAVLGQRMEFGEAWAQLRPRLLALLGLTFAYGAIVFLGLLLCIIPGIWLYVLFGLATPALILERQSIGRAFGRSRDLVQGSWWRVFGILLLAGIIAVVIGQIIQTPFAIAGGGFSSMFSAEPEAPTLTMLILSAIGATIAGTITYPFSAGVTALLYVDQRMRREALDIELARAAGVTLPGQPGQPGQPGAPGAPPPQSW
jgi:hypothetical protein